jgi:CYTH domain-containing protein
MTSAHKYARIESERRFLLRDLAPDLDTRDFSRITDRYWPGTRMRLRLIESADGQVIARKLTQKYVEPDRTLEETIITNQYLTDAEYALFSQLPGVELVKRRTKYLHNGSGYSIDLFAGELDGLLLAEIEAGQGILPAGAVPSFAVCEVTEELAFTGGALVNTDAGQLAALLEEWLGAG